jgi:hypothetical protein
MRQLLRKRLHLAFSAIAAANQAPRLAHQALEMPNELAERLAIIARIRNSRRMDRARLLERLVLILEQIRRIVCRRIQRGNPRAPYCPW